MIVFNLSCNTCGLDFEGWFESSNEGHNQAHQYLNQQLKLHASKG